MYIEIKCEHCGAEYTIEYDEDSETMAPEYCPFCGELIIDLDTSDE